MKRVQVVLQMSVQSPNSLSPRLRGPASQPVDFQHHSPPLISLIDRVWLPHRLKDDSENVAMETAVTTLSGRSSSLFTIACISIPPPPALPFGGMQAPIILVLHSWMTHDPLVSYVPSR